VFDVIVVFNHPFPGNVERARAWNSRFGPVSVVAPPDGGGEVTYEVGSYFWQAAVVAALRASPRKHAHTLVIQDDALLAPDLDLGALLGSEPDNTALCHTAVPLAGPLMSGWPWTLRQALLWSRSGDSLFGVGTYDARQTLLNSKIYRRNSERIGRLPVASMIPDPDGDPKRPWAAPLQGLLPIGEKGYSFGIPFYHGFSDFFTFPNRIADEVEDFLARTVRCGIFCEIAIPTMLRWSGVSVVSCSQRFDTRWGEERAGLEFRSQREVAEFFSQHPELIGAHPIKFSLLED